MTTPLSVVSTAKVGRARSTGGLTMWPMLGQNGHKPAYDLAAAAFEVGSLTVTEVSDGGSVPTLLVVNAGDRPVLLLDGEQLVGAKQNRVLNVTVLVPAHSKLDVPVSCVEQGRWGYRRRTFATDDYIMNADLRARKMRDVSDTLRQRRSRSGDQVAVWAGIADKAESLAAPSPTGAMRDTFEQHRSRLDESTRRLEPVDHQLGAIFATRNRILGLEWFDSHATLRAMLPKLVRSHALEVLGPGNKGTRPRAHQRDQFLASLDTLDIERYPAVGLGTECRMSGPGLHGAALELDESVIHLSVLADGGGAPGGSTSPPDTIA